MEELSYYGLTVVEILGLLKALITFGGAAIVVSAGILLLLNGNNNGF